jgi:beta-lactamase class A
VRLPALPGLQALLNEEAERMPGEVSIHVRVEGGAAGAGAGEAGVDAETPVPAASVIKLPIMVAVQNAWQTGFLTRTAVDERRMRSMITESDNPSADALIDRAGTSQINSWLLEHGYSGTSLRHKLGGLQREGPNLVTARDMTRMLLDIAGGRMIDANASAEMRRLLLDQTRRARIPAGLPNGVIVGNKTGTLNGIVNDVAFVEIPGGRRYALAVLISGAGPEGAAAQAIARLSRKVYGFVTSPPATPPGGPAPR